jgi:uncharacterized protein (DUF2147 family)
MKRIIFAFAGLAFAVSPASALTKSLEGRWKNGAMEIVIAKCGGALCGTVVKASEKQQAKAERGSGTHLLGARVIDNIQPSGPGKWYANVFVASRDRLSVRGCLLAVICKTTHWDRID